MNPKLTARVQDRDGKGTSQGRSDAKRALLTEAAQEVDNVSVKQIPIIINVTL